MTDVEIPFGENTKDVATLLLAAAEKLELPAESVRTTSDGFLVPEEVADLAGEDWEATPAEEPKKAPAKKSTSKKSEA